MARLSEAQKTFIVQQLACWRTPTEVADLVTEEWPGTEIDRRQVHKYNPETPNCQAAKKYRELYYKTREQFVEAAAKLGIAQPAFRLQKMMDVLRQAERVGNHGMVLQVLEQAAKETGGSYANKRVLEHSGSIAHPVLRVVSRDPAGTPDDAA